MLSGNVKLAMSHVVPDLVQKVVKGQDPLHILGDGNQVRHYTYGGDLARGIVTAMEHPDALNDDFNLSTAESTTVLELAEKIWRRIQGRHAVPLRERRAVRARRAERVPSVEKAKRGPRLRGDDHARRDARRGRAVGRRRDRQGPDLTHTTTRTASPRTCDICRPARSTAVGILSITLAS